MRDSNFLKEGESIADFVAELRSLALDCNYGTSLEETLKDKLISSIKDKATKFWIPLIFNNVNLSSSGSVINANKWNVLSCTI